MSSSEFEWIRLARLDIGLKEIAGVKHEPKILTYWKLIKRGGIKDDETAWCAAFVGAKLELSGLVSTRFEGASSYLNWGVACEPCYGAIALISRQGGSGWHVGFLVGKDNAGNYKVLGGNQNNKVSIATFPASRIKQTRWPKPVFNPKLPLPILDGSGFDFSTSEA